MPPTWGGWGNASILKRLIWGSLGAWAAGHWRLCGNASAWGNASIRGVNLAKWDILSSHPPFKNHFPIPPPPPSRRAGTFTARLLRRGCDGRRAGAARPIRNHFPKVLGTIFVQFLFLKAPASFALGGPPIDLPERTRSGVPEGSSKAFRPFHAPSPAKAPEGRARWNASPQRLRRAGWDRKWPLDRRGVLLLGLGATRRGGGDCP